MNFLGDFGTNVLLLTVVYLYPAFECFKIIKGKRPEMEQLRFWCQYWIIVALLTSFERFCDMMVSWLPMYDEGKLAFMVYLWHPKTMGASYIYDNFVLPFLAEHEIDIERKMHEFKDKAGDLIVLYIKNLTEKGQSMIYDVLHNVISQAPSISQKIEPDFGARDNKKSQKIHHEPKSKKK